MVYYVFGYQFDVGLGVDDNQCCIDIGQCGNGLIGKIWVVWGVDQVDMCFFIVEIDNGGIQGMVGFFFLCIEIVDGVVFFDVVLYVDGVGGME